MSLFIVVRITSTDVIQIIIMNNNDTTSRHVQPTIDLLNDLRLRAALANLKEEMPAVRNFGPLPQLP